MSNNTPNSRKRRTLPCSSVVLGQRDAEHLFSSLSRDLFDLLPETSGFEEELDFVTITKVLPPRYREVTDAIVNHDPAALLSRAASWYDETHPVRMWANYAADGMKSLSAIRGNVGDVILQKLEERAVCSIRSLRQYLGFYSRLTVEFDLADPEIQMAISDFEERVTRDQKVELSPTFYSLAEQFWKGIDVKNIFSLAGIESLDAPFYPQHGPGAVAEKGLKPWQKGRVAREARPWLLGRGIPLDPYALRKPMQVDSWSSYEDLEDPNFLWKEDQWPVADEVHPSRLILVPKDYRGPRLIAAEPTALQYLQGAIDELLDHHIKHSFLRNVFRVHDQSFQQRAVLAASADSSLATIDMKDASDLVRVSHVRELCKSRPDIWHVLSRVRSGHCALPSGRVVPLSSYTTMGAKLTFKLEGIVFSLIDLAAIIQHDRDVRGWKWFTRYSNKFLEDEVDRARLGVYGDDQLFRSVYYHSIVTALEKAGFTVNHSKCCYKGAFREACGVDAWNGHDVSIIRPRALPGAAAAKQSLDGHVETIQYLAHKGYLRAAVVLWQILASRRIVIPIVPGNSSIAGCISNDTLFALGDVQAQTCRSEYGRGAIKSWRVWAPIQETELVDPGELDEGAYWTSLRPHREPLETPRYPGRRVFIKRRPVEGTGLLPVIFSKEAAARIASA